MSAVQKDAMNDAQPLLQVKNLEAFYGPVMALRGVSIDVFEGKVVAILGANGAGKTTLMKTISGALAPRKGSITLAGEAIEGREPDALVRQGIAHVPEGREVFPFLTVEENLAMGAYIRRDKAGIRQDMEMVYDYFPILLERRNQPAGSKQQQAEYDHRLAANPVREHAKGDLQKRLSQPVGTNRHADQKGSRALQLLSPGRQYRQHHEQAQHTHGVYRSQSHN